MASLFAKPPVTAIKGSDSVYVAAVPLRAAKGPAQLLMSAAYSFNIWDFHHFMVVIQPSSPPPKVIVFDFQPRDPENIQAALAVLSGKPVPGIILQRTLTRLPKRKCWFIASSMGNAVEMAIEFSSNWETDLRVGHHDCRNYTNGLVEHLTGDKQVLERLQRRNTCDQTQTAA